MENKKILNNNGIAILLILNLIVGIITLVNSSRPSDSAHAMNNTEVTNTEEADNKRRDNSENNDETDFEVDTTWKITDVATYLDYIDTMELYYQYSNEEGAWFTARETSSPFEIQSDWFVDSDTLSKANIEAELLTHNEAIEAVFITNDSYSYFEIIAVTQ